MSPVIVVDDAMHELYREVDRVAATAVSVLLNGEAGTGKDVIAGAIHARSARCEKPILRVNCGAHGEQTLDSELFGHEQGAHDAALRIKEGILEVAYGGTVFLDDVDRLPLALQAKLVTAIDRREIVRAGETEPRPIAVRLVSSTTADLPACVERGLFRGDLLLMLSGFAFRVPPLRERPSEILPLAEAFIAELASRRNAEVPAISDEARALLLRHTWPGNVRELRNTVEQAVLAAGPGPILTSHISIRAQTQPSKPPFAI